jgi:predicted ATP-binding protein involved in virulence
MNIKQLRMQSFRGISDLTLDFDSQLTLIIGNNGSGKSSILDCLSAFLSNIVEQVKVIYIRPNNYSYIFKPQSINIFSDQDITNDINQKIKTELEITIGSFDVKYTIKKSREALSEIYTSLYEEFYHESGIEFYDESEEEIYQSNLIKRNEIPILIYYSVKRDINFFESTDIDIQKNSNQDQLSVYERAFAGGQVIFQEFFEWFRILEEVENELIRDSPNYRDRQLESVRQVIYTFLPEFKDLRIRRRPELRMTVTKNSAELTINQLSDGEKNLLAMVGDLARRLAIANPEMEKPEQGSGVVLIDEIELHLHPKWQRMVIPALLRTFPNCQFIITTHSPQVLGEVKDGKIYRLTNTESGVTAEIVKTYGRDSNRILEDEMGVPKRNQKIKDDLFNLFRLIDDGNLTQAKELQASLKEEIGFDEPEFARADVLIHRKEVLGR